MICEKLSFESFDEAQKVVNKANKGNRHYINGKRVSHRQTKKPKRVYKCPECCLYHLTSQKNKHRGLH